MYNQIKVLYFAVHGTPGPLDHTKGQAYIPEPDHVHPHNSNMHLGESGGHRSGRRRRDKFLQWF